ncbi:hypothetical protein [Burkholderia ubonensis]|uniref:hypothetical protein n=1 Tax=Burkholderia ubonensis TaxID=101571 RepID=UPI0012FAF29B|nr:hypothetical protein [Burkholderia ubonensis]
MTESQSVRGKQFFFQRDLEDRWAWSLLPLEPVPFKLERPANCAVGQYGAVFDSAEKMAAALAKLTKGSFDVTWLVPNGHTTSWEHRIYRDDELYLDHVAVDAVLAKAEELAQQHTGHTWFVRTHGGYLVAVLRRAVSEPEAVNAG